MRSRELDIFRPRIAARIRQQVAEIAAQRDEARKFGENAAAQYNNLKAERTLTCAFCGETYPSGTPATNHEVLTAHVNVCPQHPIAALKAELAQNIHDMRSHVCKPDEALKARVAWLERIITAEAKGQAGGLVEHEAERIAARKAKEGK